MKKGKNYFYRIDAGPFLAYIMRISEDKRGKWVTQMAFDLMDGETLDPYVQSLMDEVDHYREKKAEAGKKGGLAKAGKS